MDKVVTIEELEKLYDKPFQGPLDKVQAAITPMYEKWIKHSRFTILTTVGPEGTDASPRGDIDSVARIVDPNALWLPDWRGNNRLDSLRNIVRDGQSA